MKFLKASIEFKIFALIWVLLRWTLRLYWILRFSWFFISNIENAPIKLKVLDMVFADKTLTLRWRLQQLYAPVKICSSFVPNKTWSKIILDRYWLITLKLISKIFSKETVVLGCVTIFINYSYIHIYIYIYACLNTYILFFSSYLREVSVGSNVSDKHRSFL